MGTLRFIISNIESLVRHFSISCSSLLIGATLNHNIEVAPNIMAQNLYLGRFRIEERIIFFEMVEHHLIKQFFLEFLILNPAMSKFINNLMIDAFYSISRDYPCDHMIRR